MLIAALGLSKVTFPSKKMPPTFPKSNFISSLRKENIPTDKKVDILLSIPSFFKHKD